jgi:hypothetical protein
MRRRESLGGRLLSREGKASWPLVPKVKVPAVSRRSDSTDHVTTLSRAPSLVDYCAPVAYRYAPPSKRRGIYELTTGGKEIHSYPPSQAALQSLGSASNARERVSPQPRWVAGTVRAPLGLASWSARAGCGNAAAVVISPSSSPRFVSNPCPALGPSFQSNERPSGARNLSCADGRRDHATSVFAGFVGSPAAISPSLWPESPTKYVAHSGERLSAWLAQLP